MVTAETSHTPMGWLKADAPLKVDASVVTADVFHWLMSSLKVPHAACWSAPIPFENRNERSVTCEMSHCAIGPNIAAASVTSTHHALRASSSSERLVKICGGAGAGISWAGQPAASTLSSHVGFGELPLELATRGQQHPVR